MKAQSELMNQLGENYDLALEPFRREARVALTASEAAAIPAAAAVIALWMDTEQDCNINPKALTMVVSAAIADVLDEMLREAYDNRHRAN